MSALGKKLLSALGDFESGRFSAAGRTFASPTDDCCAERLPDACDYAADFAEGINARSPSSDANPEVDWAILEPPHFERQIPSAERINPQVNSAVAFELPEPPADTTIPFSVQASKST